MPWKASRSSAHFAEKPAVRHGPPEHLCDDGGGKRDGKVPDDVEVAFRVRSVQEFSHDLLDARLGCFDHSRGECLGD
jgi:hypothetical protein